MNPGPRNFQTEEEKFRRIGELLAQAVSRKCRREELEKARANNGGLPEDADPILVFLSRVGGEASPKEIRERFELSRTTAFRRLSHLVKAGFLEKTGSTRNSRYRLAGLVSELKNSFPATH